MYKVFWRSLLGDEGGMFLTNSQKDCSEFVHSLDLENDMLISVFCDNICLRSDLF